MRVLNAGITERIVSEARDNSNARVWEDAEGRLRERNGAIVRRGSEKEELIRVELAGKGVAPPVQVNRWNRIASGYGMSTPDLVRIGLRAFYQFTVTPDGNRLACPSLAGNSDR